MQNNNSILNGLIKSSSKFLLASMILSFLLMMTIQMFYYAMVFKDVLIELGMGIGATFGVGLCVGIIVQSIRLAFGLAGAHEFGIGRYGSGTFGLLFSFCVTLFESFEVQLIATDWSHGDLHLYSTMHMLFQFLIWSGFFMEIRLAMNVTSMSSNETEIAVIVKDEGLDDNRAMNIERMTKIEKDLAKISGLLESQESVDFSDNGATKKKSKSRS